MRSNAGYATAALAVLALAVIVGVLLPDSNSPRAVERAPAQVPVVPSTTPVEPAEQPGPPTVRFSSAAAEHPAAGRIRALLQGYFDALNLGDYRRWTTTVLAERVNAIPERVWRERHADTAYGSILVQRLTPRLRGGTVVLVSYTSVQDPPDEPARCSRWHASYPVRRADFGQLRLARDRPAGTVREPCT